MERDELIRRYNAGVATPEELANLELMIQQGFVELTTLHDLEQLNDHLDSLPESPTSLQLDDRFYAMLAAEKRKEKRSFWFISLPEWGWLFPRLAFATLLIIGGFSLGYWVQRPSKNEDVSSLTREISSLREMVMLSLLEKESTTDRLRAVSLTSEMGQVSNKVTKALLRTLNEDENVNVRLAALEALAPYVRNNSVREELIRSIAHQDSPMVQLELAGLMVRIQEKKSVDALKKILENDRTPKEVKSKIMESLKVLI